MFTTILSQLSATATSQWAAQLELSTSLNRKILDSVTKLAELNIHSAQDTLAASSLAVQQMLSSGKTVSATDILAPIDRMRAYGRGVTDIASGMRTEYVHLMQGGVDTANQQLMARLNELENNAPDGAGTMIELIRVALGNAGAGYEQLVKSSEQAAQAVVASLDGGAHPFAPPPSKAAKRAHAH